MLITERTSDGRTIVRLHKDWHPGRIGAAHKPNHYAKPLIIRTLEKKHGRK
jgi:hypothetical protein